MMRRLILALLFATPAHATAPALFYFGQSLLCRDPATAAICDLWLNPDGRYQVFYTTPAGAEGRQGAYRLAPTATGLQLCLRPDQDPVPRSSLGVDLFHDQGCVVLPLHPIGEIFTLGKFLLVLAQGR